jgi:hypothetical protein
MSSLTYGSSGIVTSSNANALTVLTNGNVGLGGKTNPAFPLDISGSMNISNPSATATYNNVYGKGAPTTSYPTTISPNTTNATGPSWSNNNVNWTASASSILAGGSTQPYYAFDATNTTQHTSIGGTTYSTAAGAYIGNIVTTNIIGPTGPATPLSLSGEWLQIQSSIPLTMNSYQLVTPSAAIQLPSKYRIAGSTDGNTWYIIQDCAFSVSPGSTGNTLLSGTATISTTSSVNVTIGAATLNITNQSSYSTQPYTYFRMITNAVFATANAFSLCEWIINFTLPTVSGPSNAIMYMDASNINQVDISGSLGLINRNTSSMTVTPCISNSNPGTNNWTNNNIFWASSASSIQNTISGYSAQAFLKPSIYIGNAGTYNGWITSVSYLSTSGVYSTVTNSTITQNNGTINGEWLQIQSSQPVYFNGYSFGTQSNFQADLPRSYSIAASNNGSTWNVIHDANFTAWPGNLSAGATNAAISQTTPFYSVYNATSTTVNNNAITPYTTLQTSAYTYFRLIVKSTIGTSNFGTSGGNGLVRCFWSPVFQPVTSSVSLALDNGQPNQLNVGGAMSIAGGLNVPSGYVGIGTTSPVCPLHVNSGSIGYLPGMSSYYSYNASGLGGSVSAGPVGTTLVALFIGQVVIQGTLFAASSTNLSDSRIKKNIQQTDNSIQLKTLRRFKPVQFEHIDWTISGNKTINGFIAQEVEEINPALITKITTYIPNVYEPAKVTNGNIITLNEKTTTTFSCDSNGIDNSGNPIKVKLYDVSGNDIYTKIAKIIDDKTFQVSETINESMVFVYGQEVHDMRSIDTNQIISITVATVQEIDNIVQTQQETITLLEMKNIELENRLSAIEARLQSAGI